MVHDDGDNDDNDNYYPIERLIRCSVAGIGIRLFEFLRNLVGKMNTSVVSAKESRTT
jgi:hypothetical protein